MNTERTLRAALQELLDAFTRNDGPTYTRITPRCSAAVEQARRALALPDSDDHELAEIVRRRRSEMSWPEQKRPMPPVPSNSVLAPAAEALWRALVELDTTDDRVLPDLDPKRAEARRARVQARELLARLANDVTDETSVEIASGDIEAPRTDPLAEVRRMLDDQIAALEKRARKRSKRLRDVFRPGETPLNAVDATDILGALAQRRRALVDLGAELVILWPPPAAT